MPQPNHSDTLLYFKHSSVCINFHGSRDISWCTIFPVLQWGSLTKHAHVAGVELRSSLSPQAVGGKSVIFLGPGKYRFGSVRLFRALNLVPPTPTVSNPSTAARKWGISTKEHRPDPIWLSQCLWTALERFRWMCATTGSWGFSSTH